MYACKNCGKTVEEKNQLYKGLCMDCYHQYLLEKIDNYAKAMKKPTLYQEKKPNRFVSFIKKLFKRKEK